MSCRVPRCCALLSRRERTIRSGARSQSSESGLCGQGLAKLKRDGANLLELVHDGAETTRAAKVTRSVDRRFVALANLSVCWSSEPGQLRRC